FLQPNILFQRLGMVVIDRALVHAQGLSEAVVCPEALERVNGMGKALAAAIRTGDTTYRGEAGVCPVCHDSIIRIHKDNETVECGTCAITGKLSIEDGKIKVRFPEEQVNWLRAGLEPDRHVTTVAPARDYFRKLRPLVKERLGKYEQYLHIEREPVPAGKEGQ
ncbi:hypothetical protein ACFLVG_02330, partial [Chloroflexota bacterium]